jgi:O-antigen ligase
MLRIQPGLKTDLINTQKSSITFLADPQKFVKECPQKMSGNQARLILWTTSSEIISAHPLGVGISGLDIEMSRKFHQLGFHELAAKHWNPHNQFLQITAELGWLGLLLFSGILFGLARLAWQRKDLLLGFVVTSLFFNSLFESMLQRQSGIIFYLLFLSAFISILTHQKQKEA